MGSKHFFPMVTEQTHLNTGLPISEIEVMNPALDEVSPKSHNN